MFLHLVVVQLLDTSKDLRQFEVHDNAFWFAEASIY